MVAGNRPIAFWLPLLHFRAVSKILILNRQTNKIPKVLLRKFNFSKINLKGGKGQLSENKFCPLSVLVVFFLHIVSIINIFDKFLLKMLPTIFCYISLSLFISNK